ncbi:MAG TPA: hypothetical protein VEK57_29150 [Thermoanaerobaculia bacterium]|nr:hypothetical protein [Thermoanaerobaculia bacterium]
MRRFAPALLFLFTLGCASGTATGSGGGRPANVPAPEIRVDPVGSVFFGSGSDAPLAFEISVTNRATVPIQLQEVELSTPGMVQWGIRPIRRVYNQTIAPGDTYTASLVATAITRQRDPSEPLTVRAFVGFEAEGKRFRELVRR